MRDLGTSWHNLTILWIIRTGLNSLDGITALGNLRELYAAFNNVKELSSLMCHDTLEILDLEGNDVSNWDEVEYLNTLD